MEQDKTRDERIAELLEKSGADAVGSIKGPSLSDVIQEPKGQVEVPDAEEEETPTGGKKVRIPASRLKTLTSEIEELRQQVQSNQSYQERVAALEAQLANKGQEELPEWWKEAYGEDENSKQGYKNQQRIMREEFRREMESQRQAEESERQAREERVQQIENSFDTQMDELEESIGRELTATQKSELLDIVGEYSLQEDGLYVAYMPVSKAYELWQKGQGQSPAKREMANIAGITSSGSASSSPSPERPQWGDWRKRFGN